MWICVDSQERSWKRAGGNLYIFFMCPKSFGAIILSMSKGNGDRSLQCQIIFCWSNQISFLKELVMLFWTSPWFAVVELGRNQVQGVHRKDSRKVTSNITRPCFSPQMSWVGLKARVKPTASLSSQKSLAPIPRGRKQLSDTLEQQGPGSVGYWERFSFVALWPHPPSGVGDTFPQRGRLLHFQDYFSLFRLPRAVSILLHL